MGPKGISGVPISCVVASTLVVAVLELLAAVNLEELWLCFFWDDGNSEFITLQKKKKHWATVGSHELYVAQDWSRLLSNGLKWVGFNLTKINVIIYVNYMWKESGWLLDHRSNKIQHYVWTFMKKKIINNLYEKIH